MVKKHTLFFQVWGKSVGRRRQPLAPRPRVHLISSFIVLARHEAGWAWVDSMSRSNVYRRVILLSISV